MIELPTTGEGLAQRGSIAQIALDPFDGQSLKILEVGFSTGQDADVDAALDQRTCNGTSDKTGRACDESFHGGEATGDE